MAIGNALLEEAVAHEKLARALRELHTRLAERFLKCAKRHQDWAARIRGLWL